MRPLRSLRSQRIEEAISHQGASSSTTLGRTIRTDLAESASLGRQISAIAASRYRSKNACFRGLIDRWYRRPET